MDKRINKAAIRIVENHGYVVICDWFYDDWIVADAVDGIHFVKFVFDEGKLPEPSHYMLRHEFEHVAAVWLRTMDPDDAEGELHCDLLCINVVSDGLGLVRYEHDAVDRR